MDLYGSVTVGTQGQVVIPAKLRKRLKIKTGDSLIVFTRMPNVISMIASSDTAKMIDMYERHLGHAKSFVASLRKLKS